MVKISVIMPVFNVERYIEETLDSLLNQTMIDDIEVIMVDDGSTDNSRFIIDEYAKAYDNFHAHHKKNEGQGIARNYGLKFAKGEYIHFMDSDDYIPPRAYENLYKFNHDNDFVVGNILKFGEFNIWENVLFKRAFNDFRGSVRSFTLDEYPNLLWDTITCNKLFKKEFLDRFNIRFVDTNTYYEDLLFSFEAYINAESIGFSQNIFYFWRLRKDKSSITQKTDDVRNFTDRIDILKRYNSMMLEYGMNYRLTDVVYDKWLKHDLKTSLKKIGNYPGKYYSDMIDGVAEILEFIPDYLRNDLNSYLKILYGMVDNRDISSLLSFAHLEDEFKFNPQMELDIDEKYLDLIDYNFMGDDEEYEAFVSGIYNDEKNLFIEFSEKFSIFPKEYPHEIIVSLINKNREFPLQLNNNMLSIPLDLIKDLDHSKVKVTYRSKDFNKELLLKNYNRKSIRYANYDIDLGIGINNILYLDIRKKTQNHIIVDNITLEDGVFTFYCRSINKISSVLLTNFVTYNHVTFPVSYYSDSGSFYFKIPYEEFTRYVIRKYELNSPQSFNSIELDREFKFIIGNSIVKFKNKRNKIYVSTNPNTSSNINIRNLMDVNERLVDENNRLLSANEELVKKIQDYKSRKAVKLVDDIKNIGKR